MLVTHDLLGNVRDKVQIAVDRLRMFEPPEGYYVAFSGGKDSQAVYHLCKRAGVKFDAHYNITSVDPPELVRFIKEQYPDVSIDFPRDNDGKVVSMWNLIPRKLMPPTRTVRYCCSEFKENSGKGRLAITGVRWSESVNRVQNQAMLRIDGKIAQKTVEAENVLYVLSKRGGVLLNYDNDGARRVVEQCYRTAKTLLNPIVDWELDDVWEYLKEIEKVPYCVLYDEGHERLGCIGCPMANSERELERWPVYRKHYLRAFERMLQARRERELLTEWETPEEVMDWWLGKTSKHTDCDQIRFDEV